MTRTASNCDSDINISQPLVSVGIPTFNRPEGVRKTLECICRQTYQNLEIIVSDNASSDEDVQRVVEDYMAKDHRIKYYRQSSNIGPVANFQFLLNAATGEYFMWMADDDWRGENYIEKLLRALQADNKAVLAFCDIVVLDEQGSRREAYYPTYLPYLRQLVSGARLVRLTKFFLQNETLGKANLIYGLMRREIISDISLRSMVERYGFYGLDNLFVFTVLGRGGLKLVEMAEYGVVTGNVKNYDLHETSVFGRRLQKVYDQLNYLCVYPRISSWGVGVILTLLFPLKLTMFFGGLLKGKFVALSK